MLELQRVTIAIAATATSPARVLLGPLEGRVAAGEVLAVMGPSGAGKSSLLAWLAGTLPDGLAGDGRVLLDGREIQALPTPQRRIGMLFQDDLLFPHLSVRGNLLFALPPGDAAARRAAAEAALAEADLAGLGDRMPHTLSGGQRARVSVLRALLAGPRALLLDEPFSRLDATLRARFRAFVFDRLRTLGIPAVLVTHDVHDVPPGARIVSLETEAGDA